MYKLIEFLRRTYVAGLFILLETIAIGYYARSSSYTQAQLLTRSNRVVGGVNGLLTDVRGYFSLNQANRLLLDRVATLEGELSLYRQQQLTAGRDTLLCNASRQLPYELTVARVVSNSINRPRNFLTLDRGTRDGVEEGMGVLSPEGAMVGYVAAVSEQYAAVMSILNTSFKASGKIAGSDYFGSIYWNGGDRYHVRMKELSKYAPIEKGDTVLSTGFSQYFPADVPIGYVERYELSDTQVAYEAEIRLAVDVSQLTDVLLVRNRDRDDIHRLENEMNRPGRR